MIIELVFCLKQQQQHQYTTTRNITIKTALILM